jgi:hypothetical protein
MMASASSMCFISDDLGVAMPALRSASRALCLWRAVVYAFSGLHGRPIRSPTAPGQIQRQGTFRTVRYIKPAVVRAKVNDIAVLGDVYIPTRGIRFSYGLKTASHLIPVARAACAANGRHA